MSVNRQANLLGQQRLDVPHIKAIESSICGDFDLLAGKMIAGTAPLVIKGFVVVSDGVTLTDQLTVKVADSLAIHYFASESGSIFSVPADRVDEKLNNTNPRLLGSFTPNSTNFVGVDFIRVVDDTTSDLVMFLDETDEAEVPKTVPLARTIDYRIVVSTRDFNTLQGVCPIAKVVTGAGNQVVSVSDARNLSFRLALGGTAPNSQSFYAWPEGRKETTLNASFEGGDKAITSMKSWMDAVMTRIWESCGGEYWYSPTSERNVRLVQTGSPMANGEYFTWSGTHLTWQGLKLVFDNSTAAYNDVANQLTNVVGRTDLLSGECLYVDVDRTADRTGGTAIVPQKAVLQTLGMGTPPGSRYVLAWRFGTQIFTRNQSFAVGSSFKIATTLANGTVTLTATPGDPVQPKVATDTGSLIMGMAGFGRFNTGTTGNLSIGGGASAGDHNILLQTTSDNYSVKASGGQRYSAFQRAAFEVSQAGPSGDPKDSRIASFKGYTDGVVETTRTFIEMDGAIGLAPVTVLPLTPAPTAGDPARCKYFARPSKFWKTNCRLATAAALPAYVVAGAGPLHTITAAVNGTLTIDGTLAALNDRVLVKNESFPDHTNHGIYVVTNAGSGATKWVLTRAADISVSNQVHNDVAVKITAGDTNAAGAFIVATKTVVLIPITTPFVMETHVMVWSSSNTVTCDQFAILWFDGSHTILSSGPAYTV